MNNLKIFTLLLAAGMLFAGNAWASQAGLVQFVHGNVEVTSAAGVTHRMEKGEAVNEGDTITSAKRASAQIRMDDGGFIAVRQDTRMKIDKFEFSHKPNTPQRSFFSLLKGGFRAITGLIGRIRHEDYRITTPVATIGIRGTDHETVYVPQALPGIPAGTYSKVNVGETTITTDRGSINVLPNQMGFAGGANQMPILQPINTNLFTVVPPPAPHSNGEGSSNGGSGGATATERATAVVDTVAETTSSSTTPTSSGTTSTTTTLTTLTPPTVVNTPTTVLGSTLPTLANGYGHEVVAPNLLGGVPYILNHYDVMQPATNYQLDSTGNLAGILSGIYSDATNSLSNASITFSGGTAQDAWSASDGSIYLGRWQGGNINVTDLSGAVAPYSVALGPASAHWLVNANPAAGYVQTLLGTYTYNLAGASHPTDALGNVGTLTSGTFTANFTTQLVDMALGINFSNKTLNVSGTGIKISGENAWGSGSVSCTGAGCDPSYSAILWGRLAGSQAATASLAYNLVGSTDLIQGVAAFASGTIPSAVAQVTTAPYVNTDISYAFAASFTSQMATGPAGSVSPTVNPTTMTGGYNCNGCSIVSWSLTSLTGGTPTANTDATTGIDWGVWTGLTSATFSVTAGAAGYQGSTGAIANPGPIAWIDAPASPFYFTVTQTQATPVGYSSIGGVATDGISTYNTTASLSVDFSKQLVTSMNLSVSSAAAGTLATLTGSNAPLGGGPGNAGFSFCTTGYCTGGQSGTLTATASNSGTYNGTVQGSLTGASLNGAILSFNLTPVTGVGIPTPNPVLLSGVTALGLSTGSINTAAQYQIGLSSMAKIPVTPYPSSAYPYPVTQDMVSGNVFSPSTLVLDANGNPTQWQDNNNSSATAYLGILGASTVAITGGTALDHGTDSVSGINWGRWSGGTLNYTSLVNGGTAAVTNTGGLHWITLPATSGPMNLPVTGTFAYTLAGATTPTDQTGATGVLNSALLTANFSAMTVDVGASVTVSGTTFNGTATGVPIKQGSYFEVGNSGGPSLGTLTCSGTCGAVNSGHVVGAFTQNGIGAGVSYGFETGPSVGSPTKVISGVAAFHR